MPRMKRPIVCQRRPLSRKNCHLPACPCVRFHRAAWSQLPWAYRNSRVGPAAGEPVWNQPEEWGHQAASPAWFNRSISMTG